MSDRDDSRPQENLGAPMPSASESLPSLKGVAPARPFSASRFDFEYVRRQLALHAEDIASRYLPNGKRIGSHWCTGDIEDARPGADGGSFKLDLEGEHRGNWRDFANDNHGDLLDLIQRREGLKPGEALDFCHHQGWLRERTAERPATPKASEEAAKRSKLANDFLEQTKPIEGTLAEIYLKSRGLLPPYGQALRFHEHGIKGYPALVAAFGEKGSDGLGAIQVTALRPDGSGKADFANPRRSFGSLNGAGVVVQLSPAATEIIVAEGIETALSLRGAAPNAEIVAYGPKSNLAAAKIEPRFNDVTIAADQDAKDDVEKLADRLRHEGKRVRIAFPAPNDAEVAKGYDFNDLLREKGCKAVAEQLSRASFSDATSESELTKRIRGRFEARPFSEIPEASSTAFLVEGLLPASGMFCLFGAPSTGKSFIMVDLAIAVASGQNFAGRGSQQGVVVILAGEGEFGLKRRLLAAAQERGCPAVLEKIWSIPGPFDMAKDGEALNQSILNIQAHSGAPVRLVIIDTLSQTFGAGDQDKARDMQAWLNGVSKLGLGLPEFLVGTVHHAGWTENRERGSTALRGAVDLMIEIKRDESRLTLKPVKNLRDGEPWEPFSLELVETYLPGGESTLTIGNATGASTTRPGPKSGLGKRKSQILAALSKRPMTLIEVTEAMPGSSQASNLKTLNTMRNRQLITQEGDLYRLKA